MSAAKPDPVSALLAAAESARELAREIEAVDLDMPARADLADIVSRLRYAAFELISLAAEKMGAPALASRSSRPPGASPFPAAAPLPASARTKAG